MNKNILVIYRTKWLNQNVLEVPENKKAELVPPNTLLA
jgi:hypothetical protein